MTQKSLNDLTYKIIGAAIEVHKELGPGLWEKVYEKCLSQELRDRGLNVEFQRTIPINYKGLELDAELRYDLMVNDQILIEVKAVEAFHPLFEAQLLTYMKLFKKPKGILINFNVTNILKKDKKHMSMSFFRLYRKNNRND